MQGEHPEASICNESLPLQMANHLAGNFSPVGADLNPDESIWNYLKRVELGNLCCPNLEHLQQELIRARERLRHKKEVIRSCSQQWGYSL